MYVWGVNKYGALGVDSTDGCQTVFEPAHVTAFNCMLDGVGRGKPRSIACGKYFTVVACHPFELSDDTRILDNGAVLEDADQAYRIADMRRQQVREQHKPHKHTQTCDLLVPPCVQEEERLAQEKRKRDIIEENKKLFREQQPCTLCPDCPGFLLDPIAPSLCK
jgi:hypothetical protein